MIKKGFKHSEETKRKMSEAKKGKMPKNINQIKGWNKGLKNWRKNYHHSEETKRKIGLANSISNKGHIPWNKGKPMLMKTRIKLSKKNKGKIPWNKGIKTQDYLTKQGRTYISKNAKKNINIIKNQFKKGQFSGKKHHNWQGGITPKNKLIRNSFKYKEWRKKVFKRDNYTCQGCDERGFELHPHHLISFAHYPEYRFEEWNGQTACRDCHVNLHHELGR